jgi:tetratricopeptide (TPR) repeat protein
MTDTLSTFVGTIWTWLNAEQNAGALSALLAVLTLAGGAGGWLWRRKSKAPAPDQTGGNHVSASTGGVGAGGSMTGNTVTTNHGATPEQIAAIFAGVRDLSPSSETRAIATADQFGAISREALTSFFTILRQQPVPPEQLTAKLTEIALQHREMLERFAALEQAAGPNDRPALAEARIAIEKGEYDRADHLLATIEDEQAAACAKVHAKANEFAHRQATTRAERARLSALRFDHRAAADHFLAAATLLPIGDVEERSQYLTSSADALLQHGEERGDNSALDAAIARYREALPPRDRYPALWARVQNNLGNALSILGERANDSNLLLQAVDAYKSASLERTRGSAPIAWAGMQDNLGTVLSILGVRENDSERLRQAVDAYHKALHELLPDRAPLDWARTQNNLGNALKNLGMQEGDSTQLRQAVDAYKYALSKRTQESVPLGWAMTQSNMGNALRVLAELSRDVDSAKMAISAHEQALEMFTRQNTPYFVTLATDNLAEARATLAELEGGAPPHQ